jgi:CDP-diacylglycerol--glycerol-3-phosphate 3-phosphatidyltransferase
MARLWLSLAVFVALHLQAYWWALGLFVLTVGTDWLDGFLARRWNQITQFGRIVDPLADKVVICGVFVFLAASPDSCVAPWMAVVVLIRELAVTVIRSFLERHGADFSAQLSGKLKMVLQCAGAACSMWILGRYQHGQEVTDWMTSLTVGLVWLSVVATFASGIIYWPSASKLFRKIEQEPTP